MSIGYKLNIENIKNQSFNVIILIRNIFIVANVWHEQYIYYVGIIKIVYLYYIYNKSTENNFFSNI